MKRTKQTGCGKRLAALAVILAAAGIFGCGAPQVMRGEVLPPEVSFQGMQLGMPTERGWPVAATLQLTNPNPQPLDILGYDYDLWLEGRSVAQGYSRERIFLPPRGQAVVNFPIFVKLPAVMGLAPVVLQRENINYQISGGFRLASLLGGFRVPFRFRGQTTRQEGMELLRLYVK
jgi:LEA14-like dessication related protein